VSPSATTKGSGRFAVTALDEAVVAAIDSKTHTNHDCRSRSNTSAYRCSGIDSIHRLSRAQNVALTRSPGRTRTNDRAVSSLRS